MRLLRRADAWIFLLHVAAALLWRYAGGVRMEDGHAWDWFWQTIPLADLRADLLGEIWDLHAQPPLLNLWGGLLDRLIAGDMRGPLQLSWILVGGLAAAASFRLLRILTGSPVFSLVAGGLLALSPGLFIYEAYPLYTLPAAALVLFAVAGLARWREVGYDRWLLGFLGALVALTLLRSAFHLIVPAAGLCAAILLARGRRRRLALLGLLVLLPAVGWYAKNMAQFGFFGASSWAGQGLWRIAASGRHKEELHRLAEEGVVDPDVARIRAFSPPSAFAHRFGAPDRDDLHADTVPAISRLYGESAFRLLRRAPRQYLRTAGRGYGIYCGPSTRFKHVRPFAERIGLLEKAWVGALTVGGVVSFRQGSLYYFLIPGALLLWLVSLSVLSRGSLRALLRLLRADAAMAAGFGLVGYVTLVGCLFEFGENDRIKFMAEPLFLVLLLALVHRCATKFRHLGKEIRSSSS